MILEARDVSYFYPAQKDRKVLDQVTMGFEKGYMYAMTGASGSGKTTFLSLLAGLDCPSSGKILYEGTDIRENGLNKHRRDHSSLVFQNYNLVDYLTACENVMLSGCGKEEAFRRLEEVGIPEELFTRNVLRMSGGQQQRVAIARALARNTDVLLADEPTGNLDEPTAEEVIGILKRNAHEKQKCVIVVTHSKELADEADIVAQIKEGVLTRPF